LLKGGAASHTSNDKLVAENSHHCERPPALEHHVRLSERYLREARAARNRAFREWVQWQRAHIF
jgi:hypothetical protein